MKLAFSTVAYTRVPVEQALRQISEIGYAGVEVLADAPHAYPNLMDEAMAERFRRALEETRLTVSNLNANSTLGYWKDAPSEPIYEPSLISPNLQHRGDRIRMIRSCLAFGKAIGAGSVSITSGRLLPGMPPQRAAAQLSESMKSILEDADRLRINVGLHCAYGLFIESLDELLDWFGRLGAMHLGANLDVGYCHVRGESISSWVQRLTGRLCNVQIADMTGRKSYPLIPGLGQVDWSGLLTALRGAGYERFLTIHLPTYVSDSQPAAHKSFTFLKRLLEPS